MSIDALTPDAHPAMEQPSATDGAPGGTPTPNARPWAMIGAEPMARSPGGATDTRSASSQTQTIVRSLGGEDFRRAEEPAITKGLSPAGVDARPTNLVSTSNERSSGGTELAGRQGCGDAHGSTAASDRPADRQQRFDAHALRAVGSDAAPGPAAKVSAVSRCASLLDPALALAADMLDDIERVRIANENRLRQLTRSVEDKDGETRGFGLDESHPDVARLAAIVATLGQVEVDATKHLEKVMRRHPLHGWAKSMRGIGDKQIARLLAAIGDPYWRPELSREDGTVIPAGPRTVSALWAYCGYHTLPVASHRLLAAQEQHAGGGTNFLAGQGTYDTHGHPAGRDQLAASHPHQPDLDAHETHAWVAARRQRGQKANWSTKAKMRAYLIAESCGKQLVKPCAAGEHVEDCRCSPYRLLYERRKANTEGRVHAVACIRCGPSGKPAQPGTPWSDGHRHADALRIVAKRILRDLWREAKRIHETTPPGQKECASPMEIRRVGAMDEDPPRVASADGSSTQTAQPWKETV